MLFDGTLGKAHARGNVSLTHATDTPQDESFSGLAGHRCDHLGQALQFVTSDRVLLGCRCLIGVVAQFQVVDGLNGDDACSTDTAHHQRMGDLEQVGAWIRDVIDPLALGQHRIAFLDDVVDVQIGCAFARQPSAQHGLVGQNVTQEPARPLGVAEQSRQFFVRFRSIFQVASPHPATHDGARPRSLCGQCDRKMFFGTLRDVHLVGNAVLYEAELPEPYRIDWRQVVTDGRPALAAVFAEIEVAGGRAKGDGIVTIVQRVAIDDVERALLWQAVA